MRDVYAIDLTISSGQSLSDAANLRGVVVVGIQTPGAWTAAGLGFLSSPDGTTYVQVQREDTSQAYAEYEVAAAQVPTSEAVAFPLDPALFLHARYLKVQSQTSGSGVNQGADRAIKLLVRDLGE